MRKFKEKLTTRTSAQEITQEYKLSFLKQYMILDVALQNENPLVSETVWIWIIHTPGEALSGCMSHLSFCIIKSTFFHGEGGRNTFWSALVKPYVSCVTLRIHVPYKTFHWISMPVKVPCPNSSHLHIQRAGNPHAVPPNSYRDTKKNKIIFFILHSWKYRDEQGGLIVLLQNSERFTDLLIHIFETPLPNSRAAQACM